MDHAILPAACSCQDEPAGSDRCPRMALGAFSDLVLAAHGAARRARGRKPRSQSHSRCAEGPWSHRGGGSRLVGRPPDCSIKGRPPPARRRQSARHAGLRSRTVKNMTWSIIARDELTGQFGIAVATRFFAVGARVPYIAAGLGAIATQALVNPSYGIDGLTLLREGRSPRDIVEALTAADSGRGSRQLHILDASGRIASHTGRECVDWCGHIESKDLS